MMRTILMRAFIRELTFLLSRITRAACHTSYMKVLLGQFLGHARWRRKLSRCADGLCYWLLLRTFLPFIYLHLMATNNALYLLQSGQLQLPLCYARVSFCARCHFSPLAHQNRAATGTRGV